MAGLSLEEMYEAGYQPTEEEYQAAKALSDARRRAAYDNASNEPGWRNPKWRPVNPDISFRIWPGPGGRRGRGKSYRGNYGAVDRGHTGGDSYDAGRNVSTPQSRPEDIAEGRNNLRHLRR